MRGVKENVQEVFEKPVSHANISLRLNNYGDIFSSFDPRIYSERALSGDFLEEAKMASRDKVSGGLILQLMVPSKGRNESDENLIKRRLREHFRKHYLMLVRDMKLTKERGILMTFAGVLFIAIATYISTLNFDTFLSHFAIVLLEPAGWFTAWTGLDEIYYTVRQKKPDLDFYEKMSNAEMLFIGY
ncbi:MAG: hypothetical protein AABX35_04400 [Nanoarchaeota archaeon]